MPSVLAAPHFHDEAAAYAYIEARVWPDGRICPHCGVFDRSGPLTGKSNRIGLYKCYACRRPFSVKVGTVMESSHIPLHVWLQAMHLMTSSKKGISANQLHRTLGMTLKSAWFLAHRIREAMRETRIFGDMGGPGEIVEADETYVGGKEANKHKSKRQPRMHGGKGKEPVLSLIERGGRAASYHVADVTAATVRPLIMGAVSRQSRLHTDDAPMYGVFGWRFASHETVVHSADEYVRGDVHTNSAESYFATFKRGLYGVYHHVSEGHLHRYLAEFDFRYNQRIKLGIGDVERADRALRGVSGKRLTYATPRSRRARSLNAEPPF